MHGTGDVDNIFGAAPDYSDEIQEMYGDADEEIADDASNPSDEGDDDNVTDDQDEETTEGDEQDEIEDESDDADDVSEDDHQEVDYDFDSVLEQVNNVAVNQLGLNIQPNINQQVLQYNQQGYAYNQATQQWAYNPQQASIDYNHAMQELMGYQQKQMQLQTLQHEVAMLSTTDEDFANVAPSFMALAAEKPHFLDMEGGVQDLYTLSKAQYLLENMDTIANMIIEEYKKTSHTKAKVAPSKNNTRANSKPVNSAADDIVASIVDARPRKLF